MMVRCSGKGQISKVFRAWHWWTQNLSDIWLVRCQSRGARRKFFSSDIEMSADCLWSDPSFNDTHRDSEHTCGPGALLENIPLFHIDDIIFTFRYPVKIPSASRISPRKQSQFIQRTVTLPHVTFLYQTICRCNSRVKDFQWLEYVHTTVSHN